MADIDAQLEKILKTFDKDGDGNLTWDEVYSHMKQNPNIKDPLIAAKSMFDYYNRDADTENLTTEEIRYMLESKKLRNEWIKSEKALKAKAKYFKQKFDTDKNGVITFDEMYQLYLKDPDFEEDDESLTAEQREKAKCRRAKSSCKYFFNAVDKDKNGKLSYFEIKEYLAKHPEFELGPSQ
ncbi:hypothetical protein ACTFIU_002153 [Dictyostelium citrinum]